MSASSSDTTQAPRSSTTLLSSLLKPLPSWLLSSLSSLPSSSSASLSKPSTQSVPTSFPTAYESALLEETDSVWDSHDVSQQCRDRETQLEREWNEWFAGDCEGLDVGYGGGLLNDVSDGGLTLSKAYEMEMEVESERDEHRDDASMDESDGLEEIYARALSHSPIEQERTWRARKIALDRISGFLGHLRGESSKRSNNEKLDIAWATSAHA